MTRRPEQLNRYRVPTWLLLLISAVGFVGVIGIGGDRAEAATTSVAVVLHDATPDPTTDRTPERVAVIGGCLTAATTALAAVAVFAVADFRRRRAGGPTRKAPAHVES